MAKTSSKVTSVNRQVASLRASGLTEQDIERLMLVRERYEQGAYSEETLESKRLLFVRWLYEQGRIRENED